jgi:hypothetical protein
VAVKYDITVRADRDFYLPITVQTTLGNPASLTSYIPVMTVKSTVNDPDAKALYKSQPWAANLPVGQFTFKIPRATNNAWYVAPPSGSGPVSSTIVYDVAMQDVAPVKNWVTLLEGGVTIIPPVTRSIP